MKKPNILVVDLDGTLIRTDLLLESALILLKSNPFNIFLCIIWVLKGKSVLKARIAERVDLEVEMLPYSDEVLQFIGIEKANNKDKIVVLATASNVKYASQVASHLNIFDEVLASTEDLNLSAKKKSNELITRYGRGAYDYIGNSRDDIDVWKDSNEILVANPDFGVISKLRSHTLISVKKNFFSALIRAIRPHQWAKNLLIFIPLLASHQIFNFELVMNGLLAFFCFSCMASSVYILNDLLDIPDDRHHARKKLRPFASGDLSISAGLFLFPLFLLVSIIVSYLYLPSSFLAVLSIYYVTTLSYSLHLKRYMIVDVVVLALLYTFRIVGGVYACQTNLTFWILAFSMFLFLSLAFVKRYTELFDVRKSGVNGKTKGRGYFPEDLELISSLGSAAGYLSVLVLALYIQEDTTTRLYSYPELIWFACPILIFWISRVWILAHRGLMHDDPVIFAIKDRLSIFVGLLFAFVFWLAI